MTTRKAALEASALRSSTIKGEAKVRLCARGRRDRPRRRPTRLATAEHPRAEQVGGQAPPDGDGHPLPGTTRLARVRRAPVGYPLRGRLRGHPRHVRHGADEHGPLQPPGPASDTSRGTFRRRRRARGRSCAAATFSKEKRCSSGSIGERLAPAIRTGAGASESVLRLLVRLIRMGRSTSPKGIDR